MNLKEWEEFWVYLVGDYSIMEQMGTNHLDSVGEFLEWKRQEWITNHDIYPAEGMVEAGRKIIQSFVRKAKSEVKE